MWKIQWSELQPIVNYANRLRCELGFRFGPRVIYDHQFIYVLKGAGTANIEGRHYHAKEGDLFYYGPHIVHTFQADDRDPFELLGIHFMLAADLADAKKPVGIGEPSQKGIAHQESMNKVCIGETHLQQLMLQDHLHLKGMNASNLMLQIVDQYKRDNSLSAVINRGLMLHLLYLLYEHCQDTALHLAPQQKILYDVKKSWMSMLIYRIPAFGWFNGRDIRKII